MTTICDTYSAECNAGMPQSCSGYDEDGELCEHPWHDEQFAKYVAQG